MQWAAQKMWQLKGSALQDLKVTSGTELWKTPNTVPIFTGVKFLFKTSRDRRGAHQLDEGAVGVQGLGHDVVVELAVLVGTSEDAVEGALVVLVELHAHAVPVAQQLLRAHRWPEVHQPRACIGRLLHSPKVAVKAPAHLRCTELQVPPGGHSLLHMRWTMLSGNTEPRVQNLPEPAYVM